MYNILQLLQRIGFLCLFVFFQEVRLSTLLKAERDNVSSRVSQSCQKDDSNNAPINEQEIGRIAQTLGQAYDQNGIQGVLNACDQEMSAISTTANIPYLVRDIHKNFSSSNQRRTITGIINGMMGWGCRCSTTIDQSTLEDTLFCWKLLDAVDNSHLSCWKPDIVTLSLAYTGVADSHPPEASAILARAKQLRRGDSEKEEKENITLNMPDAKNKELSSEHGFHILYDHADFFILNKPSGVSLPEIERVLRHHDIPLSDLNPDGSRGLVHRLDVGTSGCLILAKTNAMHAQLISQFFLRQVEKSYLALVACDNPKHGSSNKLPSSGIIDLSIDGRPSISYYEKMQTDDATSSSSLRPPKATILRIRTQQGRKHQVRIHCSKGLQRPILLDPLYGGQRIMYAINSNAMKQARAKRQFCLHADELSIPKWGVHVTAPMPLWWEQIIQDVEKIQ
ncbi:RluA family pseudouridine synthase [Nitzschia inconspicua]|uniref:RluA family pseudouridine synthase n=1 Tax=Nitzschia inconspicua TaxID=303405 RepID=A0A9K3PHR7_9STRA|nr:RluA family pseudouridine synthase [Nitzschia inconspicua]